MDVYVPLVSTVERKQHYIFEDRRSEKGRIDMYTYEFTYGEEIDGFGSIQFCARSKREAEELFRDWQNDEGYEIADYEVTSVYDADDAREYGKTYKGRR